MLKANKKCLYMSCFIAGSDKVKKDAQIESGMFILQQLQIISIQLSLI